MNSTLQNPLDLTGKHYILTGAASGIGRAIAVLFAGLGAKLSLVDSDIARLNSTSSKMRPGNHACYAFDLEKTDQIDDLVKTVVSSEGLLHGVIHSAGIQTAMPARDLKPHIWRKVLAINTEAALALAKNFGRRRVYAGEAGSIIFISSVMALTGNQGSVAYSMSKSALHGLTHSLALELAPNGIRVNCIAPGFVQTPMLDRLQQTWDEAQRIAVEALHPLGFGRPEDIANAAAFLAADTGRWITGTVLVVDGGYLAR